MSKKLCFLISFVLLLVLAGSASAQEPHEYTTWWSDLGPGHLWSEPNNWYTMYWDGTEYVKADVNEVPDVNTAAFIGKGEAHADYPPALYDLVVNQGHHMVDPIIDSPIAAEANYVLCGGGYDLGGSTPDPCLHHTLTVNGGTLTVGTPVYGDWYRWVDEYTEEFLGQWEPGRLCIGSMGNLVGTGYSSGTMYMQGGIVNVGGHIEVGAWENGYGELNMTGGTINITQGLYCPASLWGATGQTNLHGGTINAGYLNIFATAGSIGSVDITEGIMMLNGDESEIVTGYYDGGLITVYGVGSGEIDPCTGKRVAFSLDYGVSNEGKTTMQAFTTDPNQAWNPSPPNEAAAVRGTVGNIKRPILSWSPGDGAVSHEVYFSDNSTLVDTRDASALKQSAYDPCSWTVDSDLVSLGTYYWAIDENPDPTLGQTWSFTMANLAKASLPSPEDYASDVNPVEDLSWGAGIYAVTHDVYFSTDFNDVNDRLMSPVNTGATNSYDPPGNGLEVSTTYYWRVDECNASGGPQWPGDLWRFTTSDHIVVDDFDSYPDKAALKAVWKDYWDDPSGKNDILIDVVTDPNIGGNSMIVAYRNYNTSGGKFVGAETEASTVDLEVGTDWTASGVEALVLNFYGDFGNGQEGLFYTSYHITNDQMYVALEDGSAQVGIVEYPDMNDIQRTSWQEWNIDLQDPCLITVDMNNVVKVYIGFGGQKTGQAKAGAGFKSGKYDTVWFDDIGLYPPRCLPEYTLATDFTEDCVVNEQDFDIMANDWLITDYSTLGYTGALTGFHGPGEPNYDNCWVTGKVDTNTALYFNLGGTPAGDEYVKIPPLNLYTNTMSITLWAKCHGIQRDDSGLFFCSYVEDGPGTTQSGFVMGLSKVQNGLAYNWQNNNTSYGWTPAISVLPQDEWAFCALTVAPVGAKIYIMKESTGTLESDENVGVSHDPEPFAIPSRIGEHKGRRFVGAMDDFRIYDKTLNDSEIEFLAKLGASGTDPTDANLYSHYKLDDATGLAALDDAGTMVNWWPVPSIANFVDPEIEGERSVNFRDYVLLANDWLKESPWPPRP